MEALMAAGNPKLSCFTEGTAASLSLSLKKFEPGRFISESYYSSHSSSNNCKQSAKLTFFLNCQVSTQIACFN